MPLRERNQILIELNEEMLCTGAWGLQAVDYSPRQKRREEVNLAADFSSATAWSITNYDFVTVIMS
ncbi:hypothetical protein HYFRA_00001967 [Hymenoscyphus fraxineus]|uniref:Uncharacterized protein n=1 Tax=Hymenoscyphus fraxineus TaxID=746836 RepID=A0A9N9PE92_9HELO|nr:hypothetical protein HYFRA_00001967 [Hymenoscyphus fraxineus]